MVASVLDMTYKLRGVKDYSLIKFVNRNYTRKHVSYLKTVAKRRIHATDGGRNSDSHSEADRGRIYREHDYAGG